MGIGHLTSQSHFTASTTWEAVASVVMGLVALIVISPAVIIGIRMAISPPAAWPAPVAGGTAIGLLGGAILTLLTAARMASRTSRWADSRPDTGRKILLTGWSLDRADLRPAHFLATHMMAPLAALLMSAWLPERAAWISSISIASAWAALTWVVLSRTSSGRPLRALFHR